MKQEIRFKGLSLAGDEHSAQPGELSLCAGVELHDGTLRASVLEGSDIAGGAVLTGRLVYVHQTQVYTHYISLKEEEVEEEGETVVQHTLYSSTAGEGGWTSVTIATDADFDVDKIQDIKHVGNTLVCITPTGIHYCLCKGEEYLYIGQKPPFLEMLFSLKTIEIAPYIGDLFYRETGLSIDAAFTENYGLEFREGVRDLITESVYAVMNEADSKAAEHNAFISPFFLRYCYRLYDGSVFMHSAPIYMRAQSGDTSYQLFTPNYWLDSSSPYGRSSASSVSDPVDVDSFSVCFQWSPSVLQYTINDYTGHILSDLKNNWSDIVDSVDVYVSIPLNQNDQSRKISELKGVYHYVNKDYLMFKTYKIEDKKYDERLLNLGQFFKIASIPINGMADTGTAQNLPVEAGVLSALASQELMTDDYLSHNILQPSGLFVYNQRLNIYAITETLSNIFPAYMLYQYFERNGSLYIKGMQVFIKTEKGENVVINKRSAHDVFFFNYQPVCYPDPRAYKMRLVLSNGFYYDLELKPCSALNAAMCVSFGGTCSVVSHEYTDEDEPYAPETDNSLPRLNRIYTSEIDNPFYFPLNGRNTVGIGVIRGVAAVTRALSQGQVGSHDMMVFSTDGIWVMKVSKEGTYSDMHNISREVCSNVKSICQLDQSVVFATERGLSLFRESDARLLSDVLDGPIPKWDVLLPSLVAAFPADGTPAEQSVSRLLSFGTPAVEMFNVGRVFYDYASSRVVVLPSDSTVGESVALVYSLRDEAWSTMVIPEIKSIQPGYPSPFVQLSDGSVMVLDKPYGYAAASSATPGLIITRTLTFSDTMDVIRGYSQYADSDVGPVLYFFGSNDQRHWQPIGTSARMFQNYMPGRPFRFFRIAVYMQMRPSEEYQELLLEVVNKYGKL